MRYPDRINFKGLLAINADKTVHHQKLAYRTVQHITALFDNSVQREKEFHTRLDGTSEESQFAVFGYRGLEGGTIVTLWRSDDTPGKNPELESVKLSIEDHVFERPVWIDLLTGRVYEMSTNLWATSDRNTVFSRLAVYDSAVVIAERKEVDRLVELVIE
jgi:hypothetical protein